MAGPAVGVLARLLQPKLTKKRSKLFSDRTVVLSDLFPDGEVRKDEVLVGASEIRWLSQLGRSIAGGARFGNERLAQENRAIGNVTVPNFRGEVPFGWLSEPFAWYFAQVLTDLAVDDAGPLAQAARAQAQSAYRIQREAAEGIVRKMLSWHFHGPVTNALALVDATVAAAATSFVARRNNVVANSGHRGAYCLGRNVPIVIVDPSTGLVRGGAAGGYRVTSVVVGAAGDTVNLDRGLEAGGIVAGDHVCEGDSLSHSFGRGINSIQAIVGNAIDAERIFGASRIDHPQLSATVLRGAVAFRSAAVDLLERALATANARADMQEEPYVAVMAPGLAAEFLFAGFRAANPGIGPNVGEQPAMELVRYNAGMKVQYGFASFDFLTPSAPTGRVTILTDPDAQPNTMRLLQRRAFEKWVLKSPGWGPGTILDGEGHRQEDFYRGYATFALACAITCDNVPAQIGIHEVGHTNILVAQGGEGAASTVA